MFFLSDTGISLASEAPISTKKLLNLLAISFPSVIVMSLHLNFVDTALCFRLFMTVLMICHDFLMLHLCLFNRS